MAKIRQSQGVSIHVIPGRHQETEPILIQAMKNGEKVDTKAQLWNSPKIINLTV
jgi:hypothetical protein